MPQMKITKAAVDKTPHIEKGQVDYFDTALKGFGVRISATAKTYFVMKRVNGRKVRVTIGRHGEITTEQARIEAESHIPNMRKGTNPNKEKQEKRANTVTLQELFEQYLEARKELSPGTVYQYKKWIENYFSDWRDKCVSDITTTMIAKRHAKIGTKNGKAQANNAIRLLRSLFNYGSVIYPKLIHQNPIAILSKTRSWYRIERRRSIIKNHDLPAWFKAVTEWENRKARDYLLLVLFTGMRRREAAGLKWSDIDFKEKTFIVPDTKTNKPLELPLSDFLCNLLEQRKKDTYENDYVFPGRGKTKRLENVRWFNLQIKAKTGIQFTTHDLRRVFETTAEACDIPYYSLKALINHSTGKDTTGGYIIITPERLRKPMQKVTDAILKAANGKETGKIIPISKAKAS